MTAVFASPPEPGTRPNYPFAEWLNGQQWVLVRGRDYWGPSDPVIRSIEASARARRLRVETRFDFHHQRIHVRALPPEDADGPAD